MKWFEVRDYEQSRHYVSALPWAAISVSPSNDWPHLRLRNRVALLQLTVDNCQNADDVSRAFLFGGIFSHNQADQVFSFIERHWSEVDSFLVQCEDGYTCAPAIAAALMRLLYGEDEWYFENCNPNMAIYRTLLIRGFYSGLQLW